MEARKLGCWKSGKINKSNVSGTRSSLWPHKSFPKK